MRTNRWTRLMSIAVAGAGIFVLGATVARADDSKVLAGPKAETPTTQPANGHSFAGDRGDMMRERIQKLMDGVNPTDDQKAKFHAIFEDTHTKNEAWRTQNQAQLQSLHQQMKAAHDAKDQAKMKDLHGQIQTLMETIPVKPKDVVSQIRAVLTPAQQTTFDANLAKLKADHPHRGEGMGGKAPAGGSSATPQNKLDL